MKVPMPEPGDWVRFYQSGAMVIGVVQYVRRAASWESAEWQAQTDLGPIGDDAILERRGGAEPSPPK